MIENRFRDLHRSARRPLIIAHRGASAHAPENTLEAARLGWKLGADAWELDVQLTRDGVPVVFHDEFLTFKFSSPPGGSLENSQQERILIREFDHRELCELDLGAWFLDPMGRPGSARSWGTHEEIGEDLAAWIRDGCVRLPTLRQALELTIEHDWLVNVELKGVADYDRELLAATLEVIDSVGASERVAISSFDHSLVAEVARSRPDLATGVLSHFPIVDPVRYVRELVGASAYHPNTSVTGGCEGEFYASPVRREDIASWRQAGLAVNVYTVNDVQPGGLADQLAEAGVTGIFTDFPGPLAARWGPLT